MTPGERIKKKRLELGLTQEELAKKMDYKSKTTINKIELGKNELTQSNIVKFSEVLGCSIDYIMDGDKEENNVDYTDVLIAKTLYSVAPDKKTKILEIVKQLAKADDKELNAVSELLDLIIKE